MRSSKDQFKAHRRRLELEQHAWRNRSAPTESEARLWEALRGCRLGVQFRRQVPLVGRYIVDFLAPRARLVVEVDGSYHGRRKVADARRDRDRDLGRLGYRVVRLPSALVTHDLPAALQRLRKALDRRFVIRLIQDDGWFQVRQRGSHRQFKHATKRGR